jgi:hypothetical protein
MGIFMCETFMDPKLNVGPALKVFTKCLENLLINLHHHQSSIINHHAGLFVYQDGRRIDFQK